MALNATLNATVNATSNATLAASDVVSWSGLFAAIASPLMMTVGFVVSTGSWETRAMCERREREARETRGAREGAPPHPGLHLELLAPTSLCGWCGRHQIVQS